jgi:hypothetical protein
MTGRKERERSARSMVHFLRPKQFRTKQFGHESAKRSIGDALQQSSLVELSRVSKQRIDLETLYSFEGLRQLGILLLASRDAPPAIDQLPSSLLSGRQFRLVVAFPRS